MKLDTEAKKQFGEYLRSLRDKAGHSLRQVEELSGISHAYIASVESGRRNSPSYEKLERLAAAYSVSIEQMAEKAGFKQRGKSPAISPERIEWAFACARNDPGFVYGIQIQPRLTSIEAKAFIVELYERATGRKLLVPDEQSAAIEMVNSTQEPTTDDSTGDDARDLENLAKSAAAESPAGSESTVSQKANPKQTRKIRPMH